MIAPHHHPAAEVLAAFAAGTMRAGFDLVVATHLRTCSQCRAEVSRLEQVGGQLVAEMEPAPLGEAAFAGTLARIDSSQPDPDPTHDRTLEEKLASARRRWVAPGVWCAPVDTPHAAGDRVFLLRVRPGAATARHTHAGAEYTQILSGALDDGGTIYRAGDFVELGEGHLHHPRVHGDEPCLCLFATEGRLVSTDLLGRVAFAIANV